MSQVTEQQIKEWTENPVTIEFKRQIQRDRDSTENNLGLNAYHPFEKDKTQELLANLNGSLDAMDFVIDGLNGDWSAFEVDEDEQ